MVYIPSKICSLICHINRDILKNFWTKNRSRYCEENYLLKKLVWFSNDNSSKKCLTGLKISENIVVLYTLVPFFGQPKTVYSVEDIWGWSSSNKIFRCKYLCKYSAISRAPELIFFGSQVNLEHKFVLDSVQTFWFCNLWGHLIIFQKLWLFKLTMSHTSYIFMA